MSLPGHSKPPMGIGTRLVGTLFFAFFLCMGLGFVWAIAREALAGLQTWTWTKTPCEITRSEVRDTDPTGHKKSDFYFNVEYRYTFQGQTFNSTRHRLKPTSAADYSKMAHLTENYQRGSAAVCYVNRAAPNQAVLERGSLLFPLAILFPMLFVFIGAGGIYASWRPAGSTPTKPRPISDLSTRAMGQRFAAVFFGMFMLAGVIAFYFLSVRTFSEMLSARQWPAVPCTIISSSVRSHSSDHGHTYSVNILYSYVVDDREYKANRYDFMGGSSSGYSAKQAIVARHPPGSTTVCFVNPRDPNQAVLERGFTRMMWIGLLPLFFSLLGFFGLTSALRKKTPSALSADRPNPALAFRGIAVTPVRDFSPAESTSTLTLKSPTSPWTRLLIIVIFALFWNGIISVFLVQVFKGWRSSHFEWFLALFLTPFVLIGLGLVAAIGYFFLALFNPRPHLAVTPGTPRLGGSMRVDWEISGRVESIQNLRVLLEGREEVTYSNGNKTATDRSVFARLDIASSTLPQEMRSGSGSVTVPAALMHSFLSQHNKITWFIRIEGSIAHWPDLDEEFPVTVLPGTAKPKEGI